MTDVERCPIATQLVTNDTDTKVLVECNKAAGHLGVHSWYAVVGLRHVQVVWWDDKTRGRK